MHSSHLNVVRTRLEELTAQELRLLSLLEEVREQLGTTRAELVRVESAVERTPSRAAVVNGRGGSKRKVGEATLRRVVRELGTFTVSELASELGCSAATANARLKALSVSVPPIVRPAGRAMGKALFEHIKPNDPGEAFETQRRLRVVGEPSVATEAQPHGTVAGVSRSGGSDSLPDKVVREAVKAAERKGWELRPKGDGHYVLVKGARRVPVSSTPRNPDGSADIIRRMTRDRPRHRAATAS
jgi:hypothetical protein